MKSYDETITSVFDKIQTHRAKQKRKKQIVLSAVVPVCLMAVCIAGIWMYQSSDTQDYILSEPTAPVSMDSEVLPTSPADTSPAENNDRIIINPMGDMSEERMNIALLMKDEIFMTLEEMCEYYGTDIAPEVPDDMTQLATDRFSIYRQHEKTGEIYWDQNAQHFESEDGSRKVYVETKKGKLPFHCCVIYEPEKDSSIINGVAVAIGIYDDGAYGAWFMYRNTGFFVNTMGITVEELADVIRSLTD